MVAPTRAADRRAQAVADARRALFDYYEKGVAAPAVNPLTEDRCMFCGGKTAHKPDCDHGRPAPAAPDERDKALIDGVLRAQCRHAALLDSEEFIINEANLRKALLDVLATVRAEERESQREADAKIADSIRNESRTQTAKNTALMIALAIRNPFDAESARGKGGRVNG